MERSLNMEEVRITTVDNPFNPFTDWDDWYFYDLTQGYHTCERLASIAKTSNQLSDSENNEEINDAIDELIRFGAISKKGEIIEYKKVFKPTKTDK